MVSLPSADRDAGCVLRIALRHPTVLRDSATVGDVRRLLADSHVHLALVVDERGVLRSCIDREDLAAAVTLRSDAPATDLGGTIGRTVLHTDAADLVAEEMSRRGTRRLAVVDDEGRLVGLVCRKRSGRGFCTDEGVAARQAERPPAAHSSPDARITTSGGPHGTEGPDRAGN